MTDASPKVTVVMIFLNEEKYLAEAIESVLAQTYSDWELVLVDDGSTDGSVEIAQRAAENSNGKVRYLTHPNRENRGMSASRNLGYAEARGNLIVDMDGDDVIREYKIARQVEIFENNPGVDLVYAPVEAWYSWTGKAEDSDRDHPHGVGRGGKHPFAGRVIEPPAIAALFLRDFQFIPTGVMLTKNALSLAGKWEDEFRGDFEDAALHLKLCTKISAYVDDVVTYRYRIHPESCVRQDAAHGRTHAVRQKYLDWAERYLDENGIEDRDIRRALQVAKRKHRYPRLYAILDVKGFINQVEHVIVSYGRKLLPVRARDFLWSIWTAKSRSQ